MSAFDKLMAAVSKAKSGNSYGDGDYFYYPARDAAGNGSAIIKFLPGATEDDVPFVKVFSHGFKNPANGKWFIENCLTTLDKDCPICIENSKLYAKYTKDEARKFGMNRKTSFICRILVVEDKKNPENEGKVFLFKFGTKIFDKIVDALNPTDEDDPRYNVFGVEGDDANWPTFRYRIRKVDGQTNYDKSTFDEDKTKEIVDFRSQFTPENDINKFLSEENFKTPEALQRRFNMVMGVVEEPAETKELEQAPVSQPQGNPERTSRKTVMSEDIDDDAIIKLVKSVIEDE